MTEIATPPAPATPEATPAPAATPAAPAESPKYFGNDGTLAENWHTQLGEEFAPHAPSLANFKDVKGLAKSYLHARASRPSYPGQDATPAQIAEWREVAGVPETPAGYELKAPETLPEGVEWNEDRTNAFAELAHKYHVHPGFLQEAAQMDIANQAEMVGKAQAQLAASKEAAKAELVQEWGAKFEENSNHVRHLLGRFGESANLSQDQVEHLANDPAVNRVLLQVNRLIAEDNLRTPAGFGDTRGPQQRADDIVSGKDAEWSEKYAHGDTAAMELVSRLWAEASQ